ncbi:MAG: hypothetical protein QW400_00155 [Candidatus Diapherotrites archaeon]
MTQSINGFVFTMESSISAMLFAVVAFSALSIFYFSEGPRTEELIILQKEHDLLKIWLLQRPTKEEMVNDAKQIFGERFSLITDGIKVFDGNKSRGNSNAISSKLLVIDKNLKETEIILIAYD